MTGGKLWRDMVTLGLVPAAAMGGQFTRVDNNVTNIAKTVISDSCSIKNDVDVTASCQVTADHCDDFQANCGVTSKQGFSCSLDAAASTVARAVADTTSETKAGLGFSTSITRTDLIQDVENIFRQACSPENALKTITKNSFDCRFSNHDRLNAIVDSDQTGACVIKTLSDMEATAESKIVAKNSGFDPMAGLIMAIVLIVVVVIALGVGTSKGGPPVGGGGGGGGGGGAGKK